MRKRRNFFPLAVTVLVTLLVVMFVGVALHIESLMAVSAFLIVGLVALFVLWALVVMWIDAIRSALGRD